VKAEGENKKVIKKTSKYLFDRLLKNTMIPMERQMITELTSNSNIEKFVFFKIYDV